MYGAPSGRAMDEARPETDRTLAELKKEHGAPPVSRHRAAEAESAEQSPIRNYVRDLVLGYNDGLVSVFAATAGVAGAAFESPVILATGIATATAGALSMAAGEYISTKSQADFYRAERAREEEHLDKWPHLERQELEESLAEKGLTPPLLGQVVDAIAGDRERFLNYMMKDEFGVGRESERAPLRAAGWIGLAFLLGAVLAVAPYALLPADRALQASAALSLAGLFFAGVARARASRLAPFPAGIEMVLIGTFAAAVTYAVGKLVGPLL